MVTDYIPPFTPEQVAAMMDCEPGTVEEAARRGEIPGVKMGRSWRFPARALLDALDELAVEQAKKRREPVKPAGVRLQPEPAAKRGRKGGVLPKLTP